MFRHTHVQTLYKRALVFQALLFTHTTLFRTWFHRSSHKITSSTIEFFELLTHKRSVCKHICLAKHLAMRKCFPLSVSAPANQLATTSSIFTWSVSIEILTWRASLNLNVNLMIKTSAFRGYDNSMLNLILCESIGCNNKEADGVTFNAH